MSKPCDLDAVEARQLIGDKALSPVELLDSCLERIEAVDGTLNAVVARDVDRARTRATADEAAVMTGKDLSLLHGLPVGIKDLNPVEGLRSTFGSLLYENHIPDADDSMVANVRSAGGNIFCKTNTPEFGAGANTKNRVYGATGNPFDPQKTCAGSSGGAAVALATGMMPLATGSDYGGSLRTPAAFCGVAGFRPSPGLVPAFGRPVGLNPFSVVGPMGRTVADTHLLLRAQLDLNRRDPFSSDDAKAIPAQLSKVDLGKLRMAWSVDLGCAPIAADIRRTFMDRLPAIVSPFDDSFERDPFMDDVHETFEIMRGVNFVAAHRERVENHRDQLGPNVIDNTERGMAYSLADVAWAHTAQTRIHEKFHDFFAEADILICPGASVSPFPHDQLTVTEIDGEEMPTYMRWLAITYALTKALPAACVIPCGVDN
ncbi:MAG: amidase family protein, partial [Hyphomicrobiales bacterium]|nr:amidase family protein [Hyphomicrobiales bacterium]